MFEGTTHELIRYLCVDRFLQDLVGAAALKTALDLGLIDRLVEMQAVGRHTLLESFDIDRRGFSLLLDLLISNQVIEPCETGIRLTRLFVDALPYRDLLEAKLSLAILVAPDLADRFTLLITNPAQFMEQARIFQLFDYQRCFDLSPKNYERTKRWMRFTSTLAWSNQTIVFDQGHCRYWLNAKAQSRHGAECRAPRCEPSYSPGDSGKGIDHSQSPMNISSHV